MTFFISHTFQIYLIAALTLYYIVSMDKSLAGTRNTTEGFFFCFGEDMMKDFKAYLF